MSIRHQDIEAISRQCLSIRYSAKELSMSDLSMKSFPQLVGNDVFSNHADV